MQPQKIATRTSSRAVITINSMPDSKRPQIRSRKQLLAGAVLVVLAACSRQIAVAPNAPAPSDNSYSDLESGSNLKIVVPLLKSGGFRSDWQTSRVNANTFKVRADDLIGYTVLHYAVLGKDGLVRLKFLSAEETREGKTAPAAAPPVLPFDLPRRAEYIRLVYLVRVSRADHNMAIVASKRLDRLHAFTARLIENPEVCKSVDAIFCSWVPTGIAVRSERQPQ